MLYSALNSGASNMRLVFPRGAARLRRLSEIIFAPKCVCVCVCVCVCLCVAAGIERLARGWTVRQSNLVGAKMHTHPEPPSVLSNGYKGSFPRVRQPGRGVEYTHPSAEVKNV